METAVRLSHGLWSLLCHESFASLSSSGDVGRQVCARLRMSKCASEEHAALVCSYHWAR